jgi:16S rRNA (guanine527-N7)-methyltransferase
VTSREFQHRLTRRARRVGVLISPEVGAQLEVYYRLLTAWNHRINLTGLDLESLGPEALDRILVEPLVAARHVSTEAKRAIDIGSGGGSPAIPLMLFLPSVRLLMVESKTRKSVFLREAVRALGLTRTEVVTARFEELLADPRLHEAHDLLTIRAVRIEPRVLMGLQAFVRPRGELLLFRSAGGLGGPTTLIPPLRWKATYPLIEAHGSQLIVLEKHPQATRST